MVSIRQAVTASFLSKYAALIISVASIMFISRLLKPEEIGVFSICSVVIGIAALMRNAGAPEYLIQERELTPERVRNAFTLLLITSWSLAALIFLGRGAIAEFYRYPDVADVLLIQTIGFVVVPFGATTFALMRRNMEFQTIAVINMMGAAMQAAVSVVLAWQGFSYYALAWGSFVGMATPPIVTVMLRWSDVQWVPLLRGMRQVLSISLAYQGTNLILYLNANVAELIMGRFLGMAPVATFNRAQSVMRLFQQVIMEGLIPVAMPAFADHLRQGEDVRILYLKGQVILHAIGWPFFTGLFFVAEPFVLLMFGTQWSEAVPIVRILCLAGAVGIVTALASEVLKAAGLAKQLLKMETTLILIRLTILVPAAMHSLSTLAWVILATGITRVGVQIVFLNRAIDLPYHQWFRHGWRSVPVTAAATVPPAVLYFLGFMDVPLETPFLDLLLLVGGAGLASIVCWLLAIYVFAHRIRDEIGRVLSAARSWVA